MNLFVIITSISLDERPNYQQICRYFNSIFAYFFSSLPFTPQHRGERLSIPSSATDDDPILPAKLRISLSIDGELAERREGISNERDKNETGREERAQQRKRKLSRPICMRRVSFHLESALHLSILGVRYAVVQCIV